MIIFECKIYSNFIRLFFAGFLCNLFPYGTLALSNDDAAPNVAKLNDTKNILFIHANELRDDVGENEHQYAVAVPFVSQQQRQRGEDDNDDGDENKNVERRNSVLQHQQTKTDTTQKTNIYDNSDNNNYGKSSRIINENDMNSVSYTTDIYSNKFNYNGSDSHSNNSIPATSSSSPPPPPSSSSQAKTKDKRRASEVVRRSKSNKKLKERKQHFLKYLWPNKSNYNNKDYKYRNHRNININNKIAKVSVLEQQQQSSAITITRRHSFTQTINQNNFRHKRSPAQIDATAIIDDIESIIIDTNSHKTNSNNTPLDQNTQTSNILTNSSNNTTPKLSSSSPTSSDGTLLYIDDTNKNIDNHPKPKTRRTDIVLDDDEFVEETVTSITPATPPRKSVRHVVGGNDKGDYVDEPRALPLRPIITGPFEDDPQNEVHIVYAEQRAPVKLACEVDLDLVSSVWMKDGIVRLTFCLNINIFLLINCASVDCPCRR